MSLLNDLKHVPRDTSAALLMRHAARHPISDPRNYAAAELTEMGIRTAEELGGLIGRYFSAGRLFSSPVARCLATGEALARGAGWNVPVQADQRLSHEYMAPAWYLVERKHLRGLLPFQVRVTLHLILHPEVAAIEQVEKMPAVERPGNGTHPRLDVLVTHDTVLGAVVGSLLGVPVLDSDWPGYLEGVLLWSADERVHARWRGETFIFSKDLERIK